MTDSNRKMRPDEFVLLNLWGLSLSASDPARVDLGEKIAGMGQDFTQAEKEQATEALKKAGHLDFRAGITVQGQDVAKRLMAGQETAPVQAAAGPAEPVPDLAASLGSVMGKMAPRRFVVLTAYADTLHDGHPDKARIVAMTRGQTVTDQEARFAVNSLQASYALDQNGRLTEAGRSQARNYLTGLA